LGTPLSRELNRPLLGDKPALPKLATDRSDDRNGQIRCAREGTHRDRLEPRQRGNHSFDTAHAFGQTHRVRNFCRDDVRQWHGGRR
jgi:hypothetical protein